MIQGPYPHDRSFYTYRCQVCGFECVKKAIPIKGLASTKLGDYGSDATPSPTSYEETVYTANTISFHSGDPSRMTDIACAFGDSRIRDGWGIIVETESGVNDGTYTIRARGVSRDEILLDDTDSLTDETAEAAGVVTIKRVAYKPNVVSGCPFCGSLNSRNKGA